MKRGEVRWYSFRMPDKRRSVLILTRDSAIGYLTAVTSAPITTTIRDIPTEVLLTLEDGLTGDCVVNLDNVQTVPKSQVGALIGRLSWEKMNQVQHAIAFAVGFDAGQ